MAGKNKGAIDPVAIRELISQGIPMKKKESEMIPFFQAEDGIRYRSRHSC